MIDLNKLHKNFRPKVDKFLPELEKRGIIITSGYRTAKEQYNVFKKGLSAFDGYYKKSLHQFGRAIDLAFKDDPRTKQIEKELYPKDYKKWREIADIAKTLGIEWGYDLWGWDKPHFQDNGKDFNIYLEIMKYQEEIEKDYEPLSLSRMKIIAKSWAETSKTKDELTAFNEGLKVKTQPKNFKDLKDTIIFGRILLLKK